MQIRMKRMMLVLVLLSLGLGVLSYSIPQRINYQGVLKNKSTGQILPDGNYSVTFRLYTTSTGGSAVWSETTTVTITNGILNYQLGSAVTLSLSFNATYYLGVQISGDSEMSPRERLTSVGYAYRAANADNAENATNATNATNLGGLGISDLDTRYLNASGGDSWQGALYGIDTLSSPVLTVRNYGTGYAVNIYSNSGDAFYTNSSSGNAIRAVNNSDWKSTIIAVQDGPWRALTGYNHATSGGTGIAGEVDGLNGIGIHGIAYNNNGIGVYGEAGSGIGVYGYSTTTASIVAINDGTGNALYARSSSNANTLEVLNDYYGNGISVNSKGTGIVVTSANANPIYAYSSSGSSIIYADQNSNWRVITANKNGGGEYPAIGGFNYASQGQGVYGYTASTTYGVWGDNQLNGIGVFGKSSTGSGVHGNSYGGYGVYGNSYSGHGVYGRSINNQGVYGRTDGNSYNGVYGYATGSNSWGVRGDGVKGYGGRFSSSSTYALYVYGDAYFSGSKTGYVVDLCKNGDATPLELGDVVVIKGSNPAVIGDVPVIVVTKAVSSYSSAVVGVVDKAQQVTEQEITSALPDDVNGFKTETEMAVNINHVKTIESSQYVNVVTLGAYKAIKVDASFGAIQPGDLLTTSTNPGYAMKAQPELINGKPFYPSGCIIGKALGSLATGQGKIPVFVGHQ